MISDFFKNKLIVSFSIIIIAATVLNVLFYNNVSNRLKLAQSDAAKVQLELQATEAVTASVVDLKKQETEVKDQYNKLCDLFPKSLTPENALSILKIQSDKAKINITNITFDAIEPIAAFNGSSMTVKFSYKGSYLRVRNFLNQLNQNKEKITLKQLTVSGFGLNLSGNAVVTLYGYKNSISEMPGLDVPSDGKEDLFGIFKGVEAFVPADAVTTTTTTQADTATPKTSYDFYIVLNKSTDDAAKIIVGKNKQTEITADGNKTNWVNMYFVNQAGKLYYRYRTESDVFPKGKILEEFRPIGNTIAINILSNAIISNQDLSKMQLNIYNDSNKKVVITVQGADGNKRVIKNEFNGDVELKYE